MSISLTSDSCLRSILVNCKNPQDAISVPDQYDGDCTLLDKKNVSLSRSNESVEWVHSAASSELDSGSVETKSQ